MHLFTLLMWLAPPVLIWLTLSLAGTVWMLVRLERREQRRLTGTDSTPGLDRAADDAAHLHRGATQVRTHPPQQETARSAR